MLGRSVTRYRQMVAFPGPDATLHVHSRIAICRQLLCRDTGTTVGLAVEDALGTLRIGQGGWIELIDRNIDRPFDVTIRKFFRRAHVDKLDCVTGIKPQGKRLGLDQENAGLVLG